MFIFLDAIEKRYPDEPCCSKDLQKASNYDVKINDLSTNLVTFMII